MFVSAFPGTDFLPSSNKSRPRYSRVMPLPTSIIVVMPVTFSDSSVGLTLCGETTSFSVFVNGVTDPVDSGVTTDGFVGGAVKREWERSGK